MIYQRISSKIFLKRDWKIREMCSTSNIVVASISENLYIIIESSIVETI